MAVVVAVASVCTSLPQMVNKTLLPCGGSPPPPQTPPPQLPTLWRCADTRCVGDCSGGMISPPVWAEGGCRVGRPPESAVHFRSERGRDVLGDGQSSPMAPPRARPISPETAAAAPVDRPGSEPAQLLCVINGCHLYPAGRRAEWPAQSQRLQTKSTHIGLLEGTARIART